MPKERKDTDMKAVQIKKPGEIGLIDAPIPQPPAGWARIKVSAAAVCATDLEVIDGRIPANYPLIPGHEWSGVVESVGSPEDSAWVGKPVIGSNDVVCLHCDACRSGNWRYCKDFEEVILSPELILPQIRDIKNKKSVIVYGKLPLMTLEKPVGTELLKDRRGVAFPVVKEGGREIVLNSVPTYMADYHDRLESAGIDNMHFIFTDEGKRGAEAVIKAYIQKLPTKKEIRRIK